MSSWEDLLNETPAPGPETANPWWSPLPAPEPAPAESVPLYRLSGPEPPDHVVRLRVVHPEGNPLTLARVPRDKDGTPNGWWWTRGDDVVLTTMGWPWEPQGVRSSWDLTPYFPATSNPDLIRSLVCALPTDGHWYQVAVAKGSGLPVWGRHRTRGNKWNMRVSRSRPVSDDA